MRWRADVRAGPRRTRTRPRGTAALSTSASSSGTNAPARRPWVVNARARRNQFRAHGVLRPAQYNHRRMRSVVLVQHAGRKKRLRLCRIAPFCGWLRDQNLSRGNESSARRRCPPVAELSGSRSVRSSTVDSTPRVAGPAVQHHVDTPLQVIQHMTRRGRAGMHEGIGARRGYRRSSRANQRHGHWVPGMRTATVGRPAVATAIASLRGRITARAVRPAGFRQDRQPAGQHSHLYAALPRGPNPAGRRCGPGWYCRSLLGLVDALCGCRVEGIRPQTIDCLGREGDEAARRRSRLPPVL